MSDPIPSTLLVQASYESPYDRVVQLDHIIGVPAYFTRLIPYLGADLAWMYLAFRQAGYELGARGGQLRGRFSSKQIEAWSGIVPRTFWNRVAKAETWQKLAGLVWQVQDPEALWQEGQEGLRREPNQYAVSMTLPLTPDDASALRHWLLKMTERYNLARALAQAVETPLEELFSEPAGEGQPETVFALVEALFREELKGPERSIYQEWMTRLHRHIMGRKRLEISHFFAKGVLPYLGAGPSLLWILLRERADERGHVSVPGGYAELAAWLGLERPLTIWEWLNGMVTEGRQASRKASSGKSRSGGRQASPLGTLRNPILPLYVREVSQGRAGQAFPNAPRVFEVTLEEIPLLLLRYPKGFVEDPQRLESWLSEQELFTRFAHPIHAVCTPLFTRFAQDIHAVCTVLNTPLTPLISCADAQEEKVADTPDLVPYPTRPAEAFEHPDLILFEQVSGVFAGKDDWVYSIDYIRRIRAANPGKSDEQLIQDGKEFFAEWERRGYGPFNPSWLEWWVSRRIPAKRAKRTRASKNTQSPRPAPVQIEPEPKLTPDELERSLAAAQESRRYLESKGILKPRID